MNESDWLMLQTNMGGERELVSDARYRRRLNLVTRALMSVCGKNMESRLLSQEAVLRVGVFVLYSELLCSLVSKY